MKTITLKLTDNEFKNLINIYENSTYIYTDYNLIKIVKDNELVEIKDVNRFRKFLYDNGVNLTVVSILNDESDYNFELGSKEYNVKIKCRWIK
tara:strand:- start:3452 stop:3730 length:279 start_codon:yes stop_codon:yes gene_type:complete